MRLSAGGHALEYVWHGPSPDDAAALVFLHEGLGCVWVWRDFPACVAEATGCGVLVYSRAGSAPVRSVILPSCGHSPHRDQPKRTLEAITSFINRTLTHTP